MGALGALRLDAVQLSGRVIAVKWTARHGRTHTTPLSAPLPLDGLQRIPAPRGEWVELSLVLEGGLVLSDEQTSRPLALPTLSLVLSEPLEGGTLVDLALEIPSDLRLTSSTEDALQRLLEDALTVHARGSD